MFSKFIVLVYTIIYTKSFCNIIHPTNNEYLATFSLVFIIKKFNINFLV